MNEVCELAVVGRGEWPGMEGIKLGKEKTLMRETDVKRISKSPG